MPPENIAILSPELAEQMPSGRPTRFLRHADTIYVANGAVNHETMAREIGIPIPIPDGLSADGGTIFKIINEIQFGGMSVTTGLGENPKEREMTRRRAQEILGDKWKAVASD